MEQKFPTLEIFKQSAKVPLNYVGSMLVSLLLLALGSALAGLIIVLAILYSDADFAALGELLTTAQSGDASAMPEVSGLGTIFLGFMVGMFVLLAVAAHIFNFWVNVAANGRQYANWSLGGGRLASACINGLKFLFIGLLVGIVQFVLMLLLTTFGLAPSLAEQAAITEYSAAVLTGLTGTIISVIIASAVYSLFSANLTQTALRSDAEGMEHPHTVDFAVVLVLLYSLYLVPTVLFALTGLDILTLIVSFVFGLYLMFTVPIAHGLRYRVCVAERQNQDGLEH